MSPYEKVSRPEPEVAFEPKTRVCLMCGKEFKIKAKHEFVCKDCKQTDAWKAGINY